MTEKVEIGKNMVYLGDCRLILPTFPGASVNCVVTSPPYWGLRDYGVANQIGLEPSPEEYVSVMVNVFREVKRVLRDDGTLWLNLGDSYAGSGKGGNPDEGKQSTNRGSQSVGVLYGKTGETARQAVVTNVTRLSHQIGLKPKDLVGIPWRVAFALQADGWYLRQDIIWAKPNPMPESVTDRCTKSHEYIFLLSKSAKYYFDAEAIAEPAQQREDVRPFGNAGNNRHGDEGKLYNPSSWNGSDFDHGKTGEMMETRGHKQRKPAGWDTGTGAHGTIHRDGRAQKVEYTEIISTKRNKRSVWTVSTQPYKGAHFATFPPKLIEPCILAGCPVGGIVLDPFFGSGTTGQVAEKLGRRWIGIDLNGDYGPLQKERTAQTGMEL